jgi:fibronectin type 3 domain-containing protein
MTLHAIKKHLLILTTLLPLTAIGGCGSSSSPPSAPTGLTITSTVSQNILTWNAEPGCAYNVYRGTAAGTEVALYGVYTATLTDTLPVSSTTPYYYFVTALDSNSNESAGSNEVSVTPPVLVLGTVSVDSVTLSWSLPASVTGVASYNIYRSTTSGTEGLPVLATSATTSFNDGTVAHGMTYFYRVTAVGQNGETLGSNEITATP